MGNFGIVNKGINLFCLHDNKYLMSHCILVMHEFYCFFIANLFIYLFIYLLIYPYFSLMCLDMLMCAYSFNKNKITTIVILISFINNLKILKI